MLGALAWTLVGARVSTTVTVAVALLELPLLSVAAKVTVFAPICEQVKSTGRAANDAIPHASDVPLSMSLVLIKALPLASSCTVTSFVRTVGPVLSCTVTAASQVAEAPLSSVTVRVIELGPTLEQSKAVLLTIKEILSPSGSTEPPSTVEAEISVFPL